MVVIDERLELRHDHLAMMHKLSARAEPLVPSGRILFNALVTGVPHAHDYQRLHAPPGDEDVQRVFARPALGASNCFGMIEKILTIMQVQRRKTAERLR